MNHVKNSSKSTQTPFMNSILSDLETNYLGTTAVRYPRIHFQTYIWIKSFDKSLCHLAKRKGH